MEKEIINMKNLGFYPLDNGNVLLINESKILFDRLLNYLSKIFKPYYSNVVETPPFISENILNRSEYSKHFPQNLVKIYQNPPNSKSTYATPAPCLHVYSLLQNKTITKKNLGYMVIGTCGRYENGNWKFPFRLSSFHMLEFVIFGSKAYVDSTRKNLIALCGKKIKILDIPGKFCNATDSFFMATNEGAKVIQKLKELKKEFRTEINGKDVALFSINNHEDYFTKRFNIKLKSVSEPSSICIAFGIERLIACGLLKWSSNQKKWPGVLRK